MDKLIVTRSVTVVYEVPLGCYAGFSLEHARICELEMTDAEAIEQIMQELRSSKDFILTAHVAIHDDSQPPF